MQPPARDKYKLWLIILIIILLVLIPSGIFFLKNSSNTSNKSIPSTQNLTNINKVESKVSDEGTLYFIDLEYDPATSILKKIDSGTSPGHSPSLESGPIRSEDAFNSRVEVLSPQGQKIFDGWVTRYKDVITLSDGKYHFRVTTPLVSGGKIIFYSFDSKKLLEEEIR